MYQLVDEGDQKDDETARIAELRNPQRHNDDTGGHVVELPSLVVHQRGMPGEVSDEAAPHDQRDDLDDATCPSFEEVNQEADADHLTRSECVREAEKRCCRHAP